MIKVKPFGNPWFLGSDLDVVNAARVSFGKESEWEDANPTKLEKYPTWKLSDRDTKLIQFLARGMTAADFDKFVASVADAGLCHVDECYSDDTKQELIDLLWKWRQTPEHWSPFAHCFARVRVSAPLFVARQLQKHTVGLAWNEVSRRYVDTEPTFYSPEKWRKRAENVKQGSSDEDVNVSPYNFSVLQFTEVGAVKVNVPFTDDVFNQLCLDYYNHKLTEGVCPEQARMVLPQSMMTEWIWSGSLYAFARVCNLRLDDHAQYETGLVAEGISKHMSQAFPVSWKALTCSS